MAAKRKREIVEVETVVKVRKSWKEAQNTSHHSSNLAKTTIASKENIIKEPFMTSTSQNGTSSTDIFQIITGSYERVLHGFIASVPSELTSSSKIDKSHNATVDFSDSFLFNAHTSAIRCLALSPPSDESSKVTLVTGSTDERINLYSLSTAPPKPSTSKPKLPSLHGTSITENTKNKELGSLLHHSSSITALCFPTRSKLLSAAEDSTITITRTRDWAPLSTIKAPIPKPQGRPSGDTAAPGEVPAGVNDFAIHPSMKLMLSVGKGEKCMRLWNLVTGKKAGVLNFEKDMLASLGEGRFGSGEGKRVTWEQQGEEFAVAFERGVAVFGINCKAKAKIAPAPRTKVHRIHYLQSTARQQILLISTEDGRIMLYDTCSSLILDALEDGKSNTLPSCQLLAQIGGPGAGITSRIKDFTILPLGSADPSTFLIFAGSSDGTVRLWRISLDELTPVADATVENGTSFTARQIGRLLGTYSTGTRITCLAAFAMTGSWEKDDSVNGDEVNGDMDTSASSEEEEQ